MKKFLVMLMVIAMASFLFVGCLGDGVIPDVDDEEEDEPVLPTTVAPIIIAQDAGALVNKAEAANGIIVNGTGRTYAEIKLFIDGVLVSSGDVEVDGTWIVVIAKADLGADGAKVLHATAEEPGLAVSAKSNEVKFTLDTVIPSITSSAGKAGVAIVPDDVEEVDEATLAIGDTNDLFDGWAVHDASLLTLGTWKVQIVAILDNDWSTTITTGDTITIESTDPSGNMTSYSWGYPSLAASSNYTTFIPGVAVDFPAHATGLFHGLTFADIGAEVFVAVTADVAAVAGYITVTFNEAVTAASILTGTWTAFSATNPLAPVITVRSATVARLTEAVAGTMVVGQAYSVSVSGIIDLAGNPIPAAAPSQAIGIVIP